MLCENWAWLYINIVSIPDNGGGSMSFLMEELIALGLDNLHSLGHEES